MILTVKNADYCSFSSKILIHSGGEEALNLHFQISFPQVTLMQVVNIHISSIIAT